MEDGRVNIGDVTAGAGDAFAPPTVGMNLDFQMNVKKLLNDLRIFLAMSELFVLLWFVVL